jgi:MFS transporter, DHA2 family, methylenomycin A resistance protein
MSLGFAVVQLDVSVVNVAIRAIDGALGGGIAGVQWVISAYTVVFAAATIEGGRSGWTSLPVLGGYSLAVAGLATFLAIEARSAHPMLPLELFRRPTFSAAASIGLLLNIAFYGLIFVLSLFFQRQQGRSALETGLLFAPMTAVVLVSNIAAGRLVCVMGPRKVILLESLLAAGACAALLNAASHTPYAAMVAQLVVLGASLGLIVPVMTSELLGSVERSRSGIASGTLNTMRQTGSVVGVALFGSLVNSSVSGIAGGLHAALLISTVLLGATGLLARGIGKTAR